MLNQTVIDEKTYELESQSNHSWNKLGFLAFENENHIKESKELVGVIRFSSEVFKNHGFVDNSKNFSKKGSNLSACIFLSSPWLPCHHLRTQMVKKQRFHFGS